jgi:16S rRNA (guanine(966)-N(2))-methyltransferase RsmD
MLRIQSGTARGRSLKGLPKGYEVRPILARIRKSLFDILRPRIGGAVFLDLFAGTGMVGLEALSNGARLAVFVDASRSSLKLIERNAEDLGFAEQADVRQGDATRSLSWLAPHRFDIVFMGPPYKDEAKNPLALTVPALVRLEESKLLAPDAVVVGQHHEHEDLSGLPPTWENYRDNVYGDSVLTFFRLKTGASAPNEVS